MIFCEVYRACRYTGKIEASSAFVVVFTLECSLSLANWALDAATFARCARLCSHVAQRCRLLFPLSLCDFSFPFSLSSFLTDVRFLHSRLAAFSLPMPPENRRWQHRRSRQPMLAPTSLIYFGCSLHEFGFNYWIRASRRACTRARARAPT